MAQGKSQGSGSGKRAARSAMLRRPPKKGLPRLQHQLREGWRELLERSPLWIVLFVLASTWCLLPRQLFFVPLVESGAIAARTYIAAEDLSVPNESATRALQQRVREEVLPVYDFDRAIEADARRQLAQLFEVGRAELAPPAEETLTKPSTRRPGGASSPPIDGEEETRSEADLLARLAEASTFKVNCYNFELCTFWRLYKGSRIF